MTDNYPTDRLNYWPENSDPESIGSAGLWPQNLSDFDYELLEPRDPAPSAPIVLLSAAAGLLCGMIAFYLFYQIFGLGLELTTGLALGVLFLGLTISSIGLSAVTRSSAVMSNMAFSCGLIMLSVLFFGLCIVTGALGATILLLLST